MEGGLITVYWFCFGFGLVYVLLAGALGMVSHGIPGLGHGGGHGGLDAASGGHGFDAHADAHGVDAIAVDAHADAGHIESMDIQPDGHDFDHGGHDSAHGQAGAIHESGMPDYNPLSPLSLMGTLCGFGAGGLIALNSGTGVPLSFAAAAGGGLTMALVLWLIIGKLLYSLHASSEAHVADMIGLEADELTPVEDTMSGEIAYVLGGTRFTAPARLVHEGRVPQHGKVRIRRIADNVVYVEEKRKLLS
jgi:hypothetical protein